MTITLDDIESITTAVWATMLEAELTVDPGADTSGIEASHVGLVSLSGEFKGMVSLHLGEDMVRGAASVMFGVAAAEVDEDQMSDAVAELTNMVGGNVKCLVEQPTKLGLPQVVSPNEAGEHLESSLETASLGFAGPTGRFVVSVHRAPA